MCPSSAGERVGDLWTSIEALPRQRAMLTLPKRCLVVVLSPSAPDRRPIDLPISRMVEMKSSAKPPRVSATRGMHVRPIERQLGRLEASLRWTPTWRAWPWVRAASDSVRDWRGEITSRAGQSTVSLRMRIKVYKTLPSILFAT